MMEEFFKAIAEKTENNPEIMELIRGAQKDLSEMPSNDDVFDKDGERWRDKYYKSLDEYRKVFFGSKPTNETPKEAKEDEKYSFEDLFEED